MELVMCDVGGGVGLFGGSGHDGGVLWSMRRKRWWWWELEWC